MSHTTEFLDQIARQAGIRPTSYAIAKHMGTRYGWKRQSVQNYRKGTNVPDDLRGIQIAEELGLEPLYVLSCLNADRAENAEVRRVWETMAERARRTAAAVILAGALVATFAGGMVAPSVAYARQAISSSTDPIYIMRTLRRLLRWLLGDGDGMDAAAGV